MPTRARSQVRAARELLYPGDSDVPKPVLRAEAFLAGTGMWYRLGRNASATSCRDAANRRERLGNVGIPIWDELKSAALTTADGLIIVHCRGDQELDYDAVAKLLGLPFVERATDEALGPLGLGYGLINPFYSWADAHLSVRQVFDSGLLSRIGIPGTMMTNAGDLTWSVEFFVDELIRALGPAACVADIVSVTDARPRWVGSSSAIGIVTGNAPESGIALMKTIIDTVRSDLGRMNLGDISMPPIQMLSIPEMGLSMELSERAEQVEAPLLSAVGELCEDGCGIVAVACNTTPFFTPQIREVCARYNAEFVSMPEVVAGWLRGVGVRKVGLIGIEDVSSLGAWSAYAPALEGLQVERPTPYGMKRIEQIAYQVKSGGATPEILVRLRNVLRDVIQAEFSSEYVILALAELSMLLGTPASRPRRYGTTLLDPLRLYGEAIAHRYLDGCCAPSVLAPWPKR